MGGYVGGATDELPRLRRLLADGRAAEALLIIDRLLDAEVSRRSRAELRLRRLAALINLGRRVQYPAPPGAADEAPTRHPDPERHRRRHPPPPIVAVADHSLGRLGQEPGQKSPGLRAGTPTPE